MLFEITFSSNSMSVLPLNSKEFADALTALAWVLLLLLLLLGGKSSITKILAWTKWDYFDCCRGWFNVIWQIDITFSITREYWSVTDQIFGSLEFKILSKAYSINFLTVARLHLLFTQLHLHKSEKHFFLIYQLLLLQNDKCFSNNANPAAKTSLLPILYLLPTS